MIETGVPAELIGLRVYSVCRSRFSSPNSAKGTSKMGVFSPFVSKKLLTITTLVLATTVLADPRPRITSPSLEVTDSQEKLTDPVPTLLAPTPFHLAPSGSQRSSCTLETYPSTLSGRLLIGSDADRSGDTTLAVVDLDQRRITTIKAVVPSSSFAGFSPDGTEIAMTIRNGGTRLVSKADWDGTNPQQFAGSDGYEFADWAAKQIAAYSTNGGIVFINPDVASISGKDSLSVPAKLLDARVSADGTVLAYTTTKFWPGSDLCLRTLSSNTDSCPLSGSADYRAARWNKSGELVAYTVGDSNSSQIGVLNRKSQSKSIYTDNDGRNFDPAFNPNGDGMIFISEDEGKFSILFQEADEKPAVTIAICPQPTRMFDWNSAKTMEVEALRVKRATRRSTQHPAESKP